MKLIPLRIFGRAPAVLAVSIGGMNTAVDEIVVFEGSFYSIFAVAYRGNLHFIALIKINNHIFEYDGLVQGGLLRRVASDLHIFSNIYTSTSGSAMKAQIVWYKKC